MRFIKAKQIQVGDVVLFAGDAVDEIPATVLQVKRGKRGSGTRSFQSRWRLKGDQGTEGCAIKLNARCLLIRRPKPRK